MAKPYTILDEKIIPPLGSFVQPTLKKRSIMLNNYL